MSIMQPVLTQDQITEITNYVNVHRAKNQAPPLVWDRTIASFSQQWSYHLISTGSFVHSDNKAYGENLAFFQGYGNDVLALLKQSVDSWYNEIQAYDFGNPGFSEATGHFTALVWKSSTSFGMGFTINTADESVDIVMNISPPGNVSGEFQANVLPLVIPVPLPKPTPVPLPNPMPVPLPNPMPVPLPNPMPHPTPQQPPAIIPHPAPIPLPFPRSNNKAAVIYGLQNMIIALQQNQPKVILVHSLYNLLAIIQNSSDF